MINDYALPSNEIKSKCISEAGYWWFYWFCCKDYCHNNKNYYRWNHLRNSWSSKFHEWTNSQCFILSLIKRAHQLAKLVDILFTDNCGIVSHFKLAKMHVIYGCESNIKIAYSIDIFITDKIFQIIKENI